MAKLEILAPFILSWEGGYANVKDDRGGATNRGVTISTWKAVGYDKDGDGDIDVDDLKLITEDDAVNRVMRPHFWNRWKADQIKSQSIANLVVDWVWASGKNGITGVQQLIGVKVDGVVGPKTLAALNAQEPRALFDHIMRARIRYIEDFIKRVPSQAKFRAGWMRRLNYIRFGALVHNTIPAKTVTFNDQNP
jgi:lysozyme family protein